MVQIAVYLKPNRLNQLKSHLWLLKPLKPLHPTWHNLCNLCLAGSAASSENKPRDTCSPEVFLLPPQADRTSFLFLTKMASDMETPLLAKQETTETKDNVTNAVEDPSLKNSSSGNVKGARLEALDLFRGLIMMIMAWDHSKDIFVNVTQKGAEGWQGEAANWNNSFWFFFARAVSDICAPGFFFTMGIGMVLFTFSRLKKQMSLKNIISHFVQRSFILFICGRLVNVSFSLPRLAALLYGNEIPMLPIGNEDGVLSLEKPLTLILFLLIGVFETMTALFMVMLVCSLTFLPLFFYLNSTKKLHATKILALSWILFALFCAISNIVIVYYQFGDPMDQNKTHSTVFPGRFYNASTIYEVLIRFLLIPGAFITYGFAAYPLIPWISPTILGMGYGFMFHDAMTGSRQEKNGVAETAEVGIGARIARVYRHFARVGVCLLLLFVLMRLFGGRVGNYRGWPRGDGDSSKGDLYDVNPVIEFLYTCKYPPSPAYLLLTLGVNLLLISCFQFLSSTYGTAQSRVWSAINEVLLSFGRSPLFFYVAHLFLIGSICTILGILFGKFVPGEETQKHINENDLGFRVSVMAYNLFLWIPVLIVLFPMCKRYGEFKRSQPINSWWRML